MAKKEIIAMLLAGGQGSRLGVLTKDIAKPAVPFGAEYRLIDFPLSNCANSGIDTVGVLTQYKPLILNSYIGIGSSWDLDRINGGVTVLPPYFREKGGQWYKGTADAVYQNMEYIEHYNPEYILVLSGDHIYKMDYSLMLDFHKEKKAEASISVITVPWEETSRFGIMNTDADNRIIEFEEKPSQAKSNLASMGIYIFKWPVVREYLTGDDKSIDFGKHIIPRMLDDGLRVYAYPFNDYWKDVGTIESYWEAHMDLLGSEPKLDLYDRNWRIYSYNPNRPPQYVGKNIQINNSLIEKGSRILGDVQHSVISYGVQIGKGSIIKDSIIMPNVEIGENTIIEKSIICADTRIGNHCQIGLTAPEKALASDITVVSKSSILPSKTELKKGEIYDPEDSD